MVKIDIDKAAVNDISARLQRTVTKISDNKAYNELGKRNAIAAAYRDARRQVNQIRTAYETAVKTERGKLERALFGLPDAQDPTALISWRDAQDRADAIDTEEAGVRTFERARNSGDVHLAKAVLQRAARSDWRDIINSADTILPGSADKLAALHELPTDKSFRLIGATAFRLMRPQELDAVNDYQIEAWANEAEPPTEPASNIDHAQSIPATAVGGSVGERALDGMRGLL